MAGLRYTLWARYGQHWRSLGVYMAIDTAVASVWRRMTSELQEYIVIGEPDADDLDALDTENVAVFTCWKRCSTPQARSQQVRLNNGPPA